MISNIKLFIHTELPQIRIDSSRTREEIGLKSPSGICREGTALAKQAVLEGIGRRAQEGDRFQKIENPSDPVAEIAAQVLDKQVDYNVGLIPQTPPQISVERGGVKVEAKEYQSSTLSISGLDLLA